jgi:hypothetical protein
MWNKVHNWDEVPPDIPTIFSSLASIFLSSKKTVQVNDLSDSSTNIHISPSRWKSCHKNEDHKMPICAYALGGMAGDLRGDALIPLKSKSALNKYQHTAHGNRTPDRAVTVVPSSEDHFRTNVRSHFGGQTT